MAKQYIDLDHLSFLVFDVHKIESLLAHSYFGDFDREMLEMMMKSALDFADRELKPYLEEMDKKGARYEDGIVHVHPQVKKVLSGLGKLGILNATLPIEHGGMQLPHMVHYANSLIYTAANNGCIGFSMLTAGAAKLIVSFGSDELKRTYADKMYEGIWQGTMAMTEPQAGSSLSDITTKAVRKSDGTYSISGQKIFISGGDYSDSENVVHLMLARIPGAPAGVKGISLFVVPKKRVESNVLINNDVVTAGIFHKMGQHSYVTTHLLLGEHDDCTGYLVGEEHHGLSYMFQMMNAARIEVGLTGTAIASAAYFASLEYAKERRQGRHPDSKDPSESPVRIIEHADIRRMLLLQKAFVEGTSSLIVQCAYYIDMTRVSSGEEKEKYSLLLDILTPVVKAYPTELGIVSVSNGLQCLGGYGYCQDFPLEQLYRDIRITTLYEGTTGIQSLDLLSRKFTMKNGKAAKLLFDEINKTLNLCSEIELLDPLLTKYNLALDKYVKVVEHLKKLALSGDIKGYLADATLFMELTGLLLLGWQWLKQGLAVSDTEYNPAYHSIKEGKIQTMKYFFTYELPKINSLCQILINNERITLKGENDIFL